MAALLFWTVPIARLDGIGPEFLKGTQPRVLLGQSLQLSSRARTGHGLGCNWQTKRNRSQVNWSGFLFLGRNLVFYYNLFAQGLSHFVEHGAKPGGVDIEGFSSCNAGKFDGSQTMAFVVIMADDTWLAPKTAFDS